MVRDGQWRWIRNFLIFGSIFLTLSQNADAELNLAFSSDRASGRSQVYWRCIYLSNRDAHPCPAVPASLTGAAQQESKTPNWSQKKGKLAYTFGAPGVRGIHIIDPTILSTDEQITPSVQIAYNPTAAYPCQDNRDPSWSPDGTRIVYSCLIGSSYQLWVHDVTQTARVASSEAFLATAPTQTGSQSSLALGSAWSPDGKWVAFASAGTGGTSRIVLVNVASKTLKFLTSGNGGRSADTHPTWSPDSQQVAFSSNRNGGPDIYTIDPACPEGQVNGAGAACAVTQLTFDGSDSKPAWSPDGVFIAFVSNQNPNNQNPSAKNQIWLIRAKGESVSGNPPQLASDGSANDDEPSWQQWFIPTPPAGAEAQNCSVPVTQWKQGGALGAQDTPWSSAPYDHSYFLSASLPQSVQLLTATGAGTTSATFSQGSDYMAPLDYPGLVWSVVHSPSFSGINATLIPGPISSSPPRSTTTGVNFYDNSCKDQDCSGVNNPALLLCNGPCVTCSGPSCTNANPSLLKRRTVGSHGCALTALAICLRAGGITSLNTANSGAVLLDPGELNRFMSNTDQFFASSNALGGGGAFSTEANVDFSGTTRAVATNTGLSLKFSPVGFDSEHNRTLSTADQLAYRDSVLTNALCTAHVPVIGIVASKTGHGHHYVVVVAKTSLAVDGSQFSVVDPFWSNADQFKANNNSVTTLLDYDNNFEPRGSVLTPSAEAALSRIGVNPLNLTRRLSNSAPGLGGLTISVDGGGTFFVTDPLGNVGGVDPSTGIVFGRMPGAAYSETQIADDDIGVSDLGVNHELYVPTPVEGQYNVVVSTSGVAALRVAGAGSDGTSWPAIYSSVSSPVAGGSSSLKITVPGTSGLTTSVVSGARTDVGVSLTSSAGALQVGSQVTLTAILTNNGPDSSSGVTVTFSLPAGASVASVSGSKAVCTNINGLVCTIAGLASTSSTPISIGLTFSGPGVQTIGATALAADGDPNPANNSASVVVVSLQGGAPILGASVVHSGNFSQGQQGATYTVAVGANAAAGPTSGTVTVLDRLPSALTLVSMSGPGWLCTANSCSRSDALAGGSTYPPITVAVNVAADATSSLVNVVEASGGGAPSVSANDVTNIVSVSPVLSLTATHTGTFQLNQNNATYALTVSNGTSAGPTNAPVTVTDTVPTGLTLISMAGTGWGCTGNTCTRSDVLAAGASYPPITVTVNVAANAASSVTNSASVAGGGSVAANATDVTAITAGPPVLSITSAHSGGFLPGEPLATYLVTVSNGATAGPTTGTVTVTDTLPAGLTLVSMSGAGWTCSANACTRTDPLPGGASYQAISVGVSVPRGTSGTVTNSVSVSGGGSVTANATDPTTIAVTAGTPPLVWLGGGHTGGARAVSGAPDGTVWSAAGDGTLKQWNAATMNMIRTLVTPPAQNAAIAANGQFALIGNASGSQVTSLSDGSVSRTFTTGDLGGNYMPNISSNGQTWAFGRGNWGGDVLVFASGTGGEHTVFASVFDGGGGYYFGGVDAIAVSADGQFVATELTLDYKTPGTIRLYRVSDGALVRTLSHNTANVTALAFSPDGTLLASSTSDGKINILRLSDLVVIRSVAVFESGSAVSAKALAFSPDGTLIAQGDPYAARVYNVTSGATVARNPGNTSSVSFTPDGQWLVAGTDKDVKLWTIASGAPLPSIAPHFGSISAVAYSPRGDLVASASADLTIKLRRAGDGVAVASLTGHTDVINSIAFSPDGDLLASASSDHTIRIWRTSDFSLVTTLTGHTQAVNTVVFSPDGSLLASGSVSPEQVVRIWSVGGQWLNTSTLSGTGGNVTSVQFSPDGQTLAGGSDGGIVRLWQVGSGALLRTYLAAGQGAMSLAWSPDGQILAAGWQQSILIFQGTQIAPFLTVPAHAASGTTVSYAPDGRTLLSGNPDGTVKLWNTSSWSLITSYNQETYRSGSGVTSVGYAPDNTRFVYGRGDATIGVVSTGATLQPVSVTITTKPAGLAVIVDGTAQTAPFVFTSAPGSSHTISVVSPQGTSGTRQVFQGWSDGGAQSHAITPVASRIYNAVFATQYLLTQQVSPAAGGTITNSVTSPDGYYAAGTTVNLTAAAAQGYLFNSWSGDVAGTANPTSVSMTQPRTATAIFSGTSSADIAVTMTSSATQVNNGKPLSYTVTVANLGPAAFAPTLKDSLPGALSFVSALPSQGSCSGTVLISCSLGTIAAGVKATVTINVMPNAVGTISNTASVDGGTTDPNQANNSATVSVTVLPTGLPPILWMGGSPSAAATQNIFTTSDGLIWAVGPKEVIQWRTSDLRVAHTLAPDISANSIYKFAVTSDGKYFAYSLRTSTGVYKADGTTVATFSNPGQNNFGNPNASDISMDDKAKTIAFTDGPSCGGGPGGCPHWIGDVGTGSEIGKWLGGELNAVSPDGSLLAVANYPTVDLYNTSDFSLNRSLTGFSQNGYTVSLAFSRDGTLLMAAGGNQVVVWRLSDFLLLQNLTVPYYSNNAALSWDGQFVALGTSGNAKVWRISDGSIISTFSADCGSGISFTPDGQGLVCQGGHLSLYGLPQGTQSPNKAGNTGYLGAVAYAPAGNLIATAGNDSIISVWDSVAGKVLSQVNVSISNAVTGLAFSPDGTRMAAGLDNSVKVWSTAGYGAVATLTGHAQPVRAVAFSPDGTLLATASNSPEQAVKLWSTQTWTLVRTLIGASGGLLSVQFSPDGKTVVAGGSDGIAREWNVTTGTVVHSYLATGQGAMRIAYSPDGTKLAAGWTGKVLIFNSGTAAPVTTLSGHTGVDTSVAWSPDGKRLISASPDGTVDVWDTASWAQLTQYNSETYTQNGGVLSVAYSPDNSQFAYGRADAVLVVVDSGNAPTGTSTTITTLPSGLTVIVDGATQTSPYTAKWAAGSTHAIGVPSTTGSGGTRNVYQAWSDGGAVAHTITTPATSSTFTAQFNTQYQLAASVSPAGAGNILVSPPAQLSDGFYDAGTVLQAIATANTGYFFNTWSGDAAGTTNPATVTMSGPRTITAGYTTLPVTTVTTGVANLSIVVDGTTYTAPQSFYWTPGTSHTIATISQQGTRPVRYAFSTWSDAGALSHTVTAPNASSTYTANFTTQYPLTLAASPVDGGTITATPASADGYYNAGTVVHVSATSASGYQFVNWSGDATGTASSPAVTMSVARAVTATFTNGPLPQTITFGALSGVTYGVAPFSITATASSGLTVSFASAPPSVCTVAGSTVTIAGAGTCSITASQAGNTNYGVAPNVNQSFTVAQAPQVITFATPSGVTFGISPYTIAATASSGLPVTFASTTGAVCTVAASTVTIAGAGTCSITASQVGNANYAPAPDVSRSFTVGQAAQAITFPAPANVAFGSAPFTLNATASSGLPVSFAATTAPVCTVSGSTVTLVTTGTCTVTASQTGSANYSAAPVVTQSFTVTTPSQTITFPVLNTVTFGIGPFAITATASSGLTVSFVSTTTAVCTVAASTVTIVGGGTCSITASQPGNGTFGPAPTVSRSFTVNPAAQTITFAALSNRTANSAPFTLSATASSGLPVSFASTTAPVCTVSGNSVTVVTPGTCSVTASQGGNTNYNAAASVTQSFTVIQAAQSITFGALNGVTLGVAPFAVAATASSGLPVSFVSTTTTVCTVSGSTVTILTPGTCAITANQAGNSTFAAAPSVGQNFQVAPPANSVTLSIGDGIGNAAQTVELPVQLAATGTATPTGFQADLNFDTTKLTFTSARVGAQTTSAGKSLSTNTLPGGDVRLLVTGFNQTAIANGVVAYATFTLTTQFTTGSTTVIPKNCTSSDALGNSLPTPCSAGTIRVAACDINADGTTNVADVQLIINEALGVSPAVHDLNQDGKVTVADVQKVINAALGLGCIVP